MPFDASNTACHTHDCCLQTQSAGEKKNTRHLALIGDRGEVQTTRVRRYLSTIIGYTTGEVTREKEGEMKDVRRRKNERMNERKRCRKRKGRQEKRRKEKVIERATS